VDSVTRIELANSIQAAFADGPATRDTLLAYAVGSKARPQAIALLQRLPDKTYASLRDLWYDLGDTPVTA
jgi:hypothetical protein